MKPSLLYGIDMYQQEMQEMMEVESVLAVGMEVDEAGSHEIFGELELQPADAGFFNSFEDDFDDSDI